MFEQSPEIDKLATALSKAQGTFIDPEHDGKVDYQPQGKPRVKYTYATLAAVLKEARPKLAAQGLSVTQAPFVNPTTKRIEVMTQIMHSSGQWMRSTFGLDHGMGKPQEQAGIITYERRYALSPMLGISAEADTDGGATHQAEEQGKAKEPPKQSQSKQGTPNPTQGQPKEKQETPFDDQNPTHLKILDTWLSQKKIEQAFWPDIRLAMRGKPMTMTWKVANDVIASSLRP